MSPIEPDPGDRLPPPEQIGSYRVIGRLGQGGMGEVFEAEDPVLRRRVAIKRLHVDPTARKSSSRLLTEARAAARLDHPNICAIHEVGESDGRPFIVMPLVEGETLAGRIERGALPLDAAVAIAGQVADALAAAHAQGVLHRDIKPSNIMIDPRGNARVMDFGLAKMVGDESGNETVSRLTQPGTTVGTAAYMSPEQARGEPLDVRSDLFSLGVVLYEMLSGVRPFRSGSLAETYTALLTTEPSPLAALRRDLPPALDAIVTRALRKPRDERYQSAQAMSADLIDVGRRLRGESSGSRPVITADPPPTRRPAVATLAFVGALIVVAAIGVAWRLRSSPPAAPAAASRAPLRSLAVLPFVNGGGNAEQDYFIDGMTDSVIDTLSQLQHLKVISRGSVYSFKGKSVDPKTAAGQLGVDAVATGVVRQQGEQWVIDLSVTDARDARVVLSHRYSQPAARVPDLESELVRDVANSLGVSVSATEGSRLAKTTTVSEAGYQEFLKGKFFAARSSPAAQHQAITSFEKAIALDPKYVAAYANLAQAHAVLGIYFEAPTVEMPKAKEYARQAMAIDPDAIEARMVLGLVSLLYDWNWDAAAAAVTTPEGIDPRAIAIFTCAVHTLESTGRTGAAQQSVRRALEVDPLSVTLLGELGCTSYYRRQFDEALTSYRNALSVDDRDVLSYWGLGRAYGQKRMYAEALASLSRVESLGEPAPPLVLSEMGYVYAKAGRTGEARETIRRMNALAPATFVDPYLVAVVYIGLDDVPHTLEYLEKAYDVRSGFLVSLTEEPKWDGLRSNQRFRDLVKKVGFI